MTARAAPAGPDNVAGRRFTGAQRPTPASTIPNTQKYEIMQLSLSVRIAEWPDRKDHAYLDLPALAHLAKDLGYEALSMRASQLSIDSPPELRQQSRALLDSLGLRVSMVTGTVALAANTPDATDAVRHITPHLDLAQALGCDLVRVMLQKEDDLPWAQRAADEAWERGLRLAHQTHIKTLCETVDETLAVVRQINRPNFGVTYEPANLLVCGDGYGPASLLRLAPHLFNVYLQNWSPHPAGQLQLATNRGVVAADVVPLIDRRGVDLDRVFSGLRAVRYDGYVTVHQALNPGQRPEEVARASYEALAPRLG